MKNGKKRQSPSVERQLALALRQLLDVAGDVALDEPMAAEHQAAVINAGNLLTRLDYKDLESIPTRVKRIETEIAEAVKAQDGAKLATLGAALDRAKKGLPPLATEKKPRAPRKPKTEKPPTEIAEKKPRKKKDKGTGDLVLHDDGQLESLTEGEEEEWLTRHPEP